MQAFERIAPKSRELFWGCNCCKTFPFDVHPSPPPSSLPLVLYSISRKTKESASFAYCMSLLCLCVCTASRGLALPHGAGITLDTVALQEVIKPHSAVHRAFSQELGTELVIQCYSVLALGFTDRRIFF